MNRTTLTFPVPVGLNSVSQQGTTILNSNVVVSVSNGSGSSFRAYVFNPGVMLGAERLLSIPISTQVRFDSGMPESRAVTETVGATASATLLIQKNGITFATATFPPGSSEATFDAPVETEFTASDILSVIAPSPADPSLSDVGLSLIGVLL